MSNEQSELVDDILGVVAVQLAEVMPDVPVGALRITDALADHGCNSVDRADIVSLSMEALGLDLSINEFADISDVRGLVELFATHLEP